MVQRNGMHGHKEVTSFNTAVAQFLGIVRSSMKAMSVKTILCHFRNVMKYFVVLKYG